MIILFDLDGTLIDSTEAILESFHHSLNSFNEIEAKDEDIKKLIGHPLSVMFASLGATEAMIESYVATYKEHYREISTQKTVLLHRAKEAIIKAKSFASLGIVTTKTAQYSKILMEHFGVMEHFDTLVGFEDVKNHKPHPEPILKALECFDTKDEEIWMIGDTSLDILAAIEANVNPIAVLSGYDTLQNLNTYTDKIFTDTYEAIEFLFSKK